MALLGRWVGFKKSCPYSPETKRAPAGAPSLPRSGEFHRGEAAARPQLLRPRRSTSLQCNVIPGGAPLRFAPPVRASRSAEARPPPAAAALLRTARRSDGAAHPAPAGSALRARPAPRPVRARRTAAGPLRPRPGAAPAAGDAAASPGAAPGRSRTARRGCGAPGSELLGEKKPVLKFSAGAEKVAVLELSPAGLSGTGC